MKIIFFYIVTTLIVFCAQCNQTKFNSRHKKHVDFKVDTSGVRDHLVKLKHPHEQTANEKTSNEVKAVMNDIHDIHNHPYTKESVGKSSQKYIEMAEQSKANKIRRNSQEPNLLHQTFDSQTTSYQIN